MNPDAFRPSSDSFGSPVSTVLECANCGHGSLSMLPDGRSISSAYQDAADPVSIREEPGQVQTAVRALREVERFVSRGRLVDVGCWTGSLLEAASARGWTAAGVEPSRWAAERASARGLEVHVGEYSDLEVEARSLRLITACDVLEHLTEPGAALDWAARSLEPGGAIYITVPDAGSALARAMGRRWWSVLPMHVQYFTRSSMSRLLADRGFEVRIVRSHAKVFTARYYAERVGGYSPAAGHAAVRLLDLVNSADRLVAPNFHDRMAVIATL